MIVVACYPRTGSSILVKCLEKSGYNLGGPLVGHHYKSEYGPMLMVNQLIFQKFPIDRERGRIPYQDVARNDPGVLKLVKLLAHKIHTDKVDVVKDTQFGVVAHIYHKISPLFRSAKYIYLERDLRETAKSEVRQQRRIHTHLPKMTVREAEERYKFHRQAWQKFLPSVSHVKVAYDSIVNDPYSVSGQLERYLGKDIDMSLINPKKTYAMSRKIY